MTRSFVEDNPRIRWCPAPNCEYAVEIHQPSIKDVLCKCGFHWCAACGDKAHRPLSCAMMREWQEKTEKNQDGDKIWIQVNAKNCPSCHMPIEKN